MSDPRRLLGKVLLGKVLLGKVMAERELHAYTIDLLRVMARRDVLFAHIPNEGLRSPRTGAHLVRMGMLPGAADFLVVIIGKAHFLELKAARGRLSPEQWAFRDAVEAAHGTYAVARTPEEVRGILMRWGALRPDSVADIVKGMRAA